VVIVLLVVIGGELLPFQMRAWIIPQELASPFIAFGRAQLAILEHVAPVAGDGTLAAWILTVWVAGALTVTVPTIGGLLQLRRMARVAAPADDPRLVALMATERRTFGFSQHVRLLVSDQAAVPMTWGALRPVVLLPRAALNWPTEHLRAVLLHELHHVRSTDAFFALAARVVCILHWFNPLAWWVGRQLVVESELACDDRVLAAGVRRSDYAELLARAGRNDSLALGARALASGRRAGVRDRIRAIVDTQRTVRLPSRTATASAAMTTLLLSVSVSIVQLAPPRDVLTTLMQDDRWEARAYAVVRLAERADSVEVARAAARTDPSPRVRAWARYALAQLPAPADLFTPPPKL